MTNEEAMLALGGAFLRADLQVKVIHSRSSGSVYMNISKGEGMPLVVRIANHKTPNKSFDFWIDTSHEKVVDHVNSVIRKVAYKFGREAFTISQNSKQEVKEEVLEELPKVEKTYAAGKLSGNLLSFANWYLREDRPVFVYRPPAKANKDREVAPVEIVEKTEEVTFLKKLEQKAIEFLDHEDAPFCIVWFLAMLVISLIFFNQNSSAF